MTNFEFITQSPEELAKHLLWDLKIAYYLYNQYNSENFDELEISEIRKNYKKKKQEILNWLNQPYKY